MLYEKEKVLMKCSVEENIKRDYESLINFTPLNEVSVTIILWVKII